MNKHNFLVFVILISITFQARELIEFDFPHMIYVKSNSKGRVVIINSTGNNTEVELYMNSTYKENFTQCGSDKNDTSIFYCVITKNGTYEFKYKFIDDDEEFYIPHKIYVEPELGNYFSITPFKDSQCYYHNETIKYKVELTEQYKDIIDLNKIQVYVYHPKSIKKNITEPIIFPLNKTDDNVYSFYTEHTLNQYQVKITENEDYDKGLGLIDQIYYTNVTVDDYFFPELGKIRFNVDICYIKTPKLIFGISDDKNVTVTCYKRRYYDYSKYIYCYFKEKIDYFGKIKLYLDENTLLNSNVFSSEMINNTNFSLSNGFSWNKNNITLNITLNGNEFYMDSINKLYINYSNIYENHELIFERNVNSETYRKLNLIDNKVYINIPYKSGYSYSVIKLERKLFDDENKFYDENIYKYFLSEFYSEPLEDIYFEPDFTVINNNIDSNYTTTHLKFQSPESYSRYGNKFCNQLNCIDPNVSNRDYLIISPQTTEPGWINYRLNEYTKYGYLKVIKIDIENECQKNIFGELDNREDVIVNAYIPIDGDKKISVKYNNENIEENNNFNIDINPFNYTFQNFIIKSNLIIQGGIVEIFYDNIKIGSKTITYSNFKIPSFLQNVQLYNKYYYPNKTKIIFSKPMSIGLNEVTFTLGNEQCSFSDNYNSLICDNNFNERKNLSYKGYCDENDFLDFYVDFYDSPASNSYSISRKYFVLPDNKKSIQFSFTCLSPTYTFPVKVYVNEEEIKKIETYNDKRIYYYTTNKEGDYKFSYLTIDKEIIEYPEIIYVKKNIDFFFSDIGPENKCVYKKDNTTFKLNRKNIDSVTIKIEEKCPIFYYDYNDINNDFLVNSAFSCPQTIIVTVYTSEITEPYLYSSSIIFTDIIVSQNTFSFNKIVLGLTCYLDNLAISKSQNGSEKIQLNCNQILRNNHLYCETERKLGLGLYYIYYNNKIVANTYISLPIEKAKFNFNCNRTKIGRNTFRISSEDFSMDLLTTIVVKDNDDKSVSFRKRTPSIQNTNIFDIDLNSVPNSVNLTIVVHPGKRYNIQLFNNKGGSEIFQLIPEKEELSINLTKKYHYVGNNNDLPKIIFQNGYANLIRNVYYKIDNNQKGFDINMKLDTKKINNKAIATFSPPKNETYIFAYDLDLQDDMTIYEILGISVKAATHYIEFILLIPPASYILSSKDFSFDIIPIYKMDLEVSVQNEGEKVAIFEHKKGVSNYDLSVSKMEDINKTINYTLVVSDKISKLTLYTQKIAFSNFTLEKAYYLNLGYIIAYNTIIKISDLTIFYEYDEYGYELEVEDQELNDETLTLLIPIPVEFTEPGYYYIQYDETDFAKIYLSLDLEQSSFYIFPISGKNNVIIKSNFYLPFITNIILKNLKTSEIYNYTTNNFTCINNDYINFSIPNSCDECMIFKVYAENPYNKGTYVSYELNEILEYDNETTFTLEKNYQVKTSGGDSENIIFKFNVTEELSYREYIEDLFSRIYLNGKLKIIDYDNFEDCDFTETSAICKFTLPNEYEKLKFTYNDFDSTMNIYHYIIYEYNGDSCIIEDTLPMETITLDIGKCPFKVYINDKIVTKNVNQSSYTISPNLFNYGINNILIKENDTSENIILQKVYYHPNINISLADKSITKTPNGLIFDINLLIKKNNIFNVDLSYFDILKFQFRNIQSGEKKFINLNCNLNIFNNENSLSKTVNCNADLSYYPVGPVFFEFSNQCKQTKDISKINILDFSSQMLSSISPSFINIQDKENVIITLTYTQNFTTALKPYKIALIDKKTNKIALNTILNIDGFNGKIVKFTLPENYISNLDTGYYSIKLIFEKQEIEINSLETLFVGDRLNLYDNKQRIVYADNLNKIGVIFTNSITNEQILNVTYNDTLLDFKVHENQTNILLINTSSPNLNLTETKIGEYKFKIYQNDVEEPFIYTLEVVQNYGRENDIIFNHFVYKKSSSGKSYIVISTNNIDYIGIFYSVNGSNQEFPLSTRWPNSFVLETDQTDVYYNFSIIKIGNERYVPDKKVFILKDNYTFFYENFTECQINYCSINVTLKDSYSKECFKNFMVKNIIYPDYTGIYYALYDPNTNKYIKFNVLSDKAQLEQELSNKKYQLQVIRNDSVDSEPLILYNTPVTLSDIIHKKLTYKDEIINSNFEALCYDLDKFSIYGSEIFDHYEDINNYKNKTIEYELTGEIYQEYSLYYDNNEIAKIKTSDSFQFEILSSHQQNGKGRFTIITKNPNFGVLNITQIVISDYSNKDINISLDGSYINYESDSEAYIEIYPYQFKKHIYLSQIKLYNGFAYNENNQKYIKFDKVVSISPDFLYSYKDYDDVSFNIKSNLSKTYLTYNDISNLMNCNNNNKCNQNTIEYGKDYFINFYDNVILHTVKYYFENTCQSVNDKKDLIFNLHTETNISNIEKKVLKLFNKKNNKQIYNSIVYNDFITENKIKIYKFRINSLNLTEGNYYVNYNGIAFSNYYFTITEGKNIINEIGNIYLNKNQDQFFIIEFNETIQKNDILNIIFSNGTTQIKSPCDLMLDNNKALLCRLSNIDLNHGNYSIGYIDTCGRFVSSKVSIYLSSNSKAIPKNKEIKVDISNSELNAEISFSNDINITEDIKYIKIMKTDSIDKNEVIVNYTSSNNLVSSITFTIPKNIDLGNYIMKFIYKSGDIVIIPYIFIYDGNFKIKDNGPYISTTYFNLRKIIIPFDGKYHNNQIKNVYFVKDKISEKGKKREIKFSFKNSRISFEDDINIKEVGQYHIEMTGDINTYIYYLHFIGHEGTINPINEIYLNKNNVPFFFNNYYSVYICDIISNIKENNNMKIKKYFCPYNKLIIGLDHSKKQPELIFNNIIKTSIELYDSKYSKLKTLYTKNIYTKSYLLNYFPISYNKIYKTYRTDEQNLNNYYGILPELKENTIITFLNKGIIKTVFPNPLSYKYYIQDNSLFYEYNISHEVKDHTFLIRDPSNHNNYIRSTFNLFTCNDYGHIYYPLKGDVHCKSCSDLYPMKPYKLYKLNKCDSNCGPDNYLYEPNKECYPTCENLNKNKPLYKQNNGTNICVTYCSRDYGRDNENSDLCYNCKSKGKFEQDSFCKLCNTIWCFNTDFDNYDIITDTCENFECKNDGICYLKNNETRCLCPNDFVGLKCEITVEEAANRSIEIIDNLLENLTSKIQPNNSSTDQDQRMKNSSNEENEEDSIENISQDTYENSEENPKSNDESEESSTESKEENSENPSTNPSSGNGTSNGSSSSPSNNTNKPSSGGTIPKPSGTTNNTSSNNPINNSPNNSNQQNTNSDPAKGASFDADDEQTVESIKELNVLLKNPKVSKKVGRSKTKQLFHTIGNTITKMLDGEADLNSNIIYFFDLATTIVKSNLENRKIERLRLRNLKLRYLNEYNFDGELEIEEEEIELDEEIEIEEEDKIDEKEEIQNLEQLLYNAKEYYKQVTFKQIKNNEYDENSAEIDYSQQRSIYYQRWTNKQTSYSKLTNTINNNDELMFVDFLSCINDDNNVIFISVTLPSEINNLLGNSTSSKSYTSAYDITNGVDNANEIDFTQCNNITAYFPIDTNKINVEKYSKYIKGGIDIYKPDDKAFCETCYITNGFDYDLTQKFRKMEIYENKTFISDDCKYDSIDIDKNKVKMYCNYVENLTYSYTVQDKYLDNINLHKVYNLPLKCASYVIDLEKNIGFWSYFILNILVLGGFICSIIHYYKSFCQEKKIKKIKYHRETDIPINYDDIKKPEINEKEGNIKIYKQKDINTIKEDEKNNEEIKNETENIVFVKNSNIGNNNIIERNEIEEENKESNNDISENKESIESSENNENMDTSKNHPFDNFFSEEINNNNKEIEKEEEKIEIIEGYILEEENKEPFKKILIRNFIEHYPFVLLFNNSLFNPLYMNICMIVFNIILIFGLNAILYQESLIEKRIFDDKRSEFTYSISKEIFKMVLSIIFSMIGMMLIRLITIISRIKNKKLLEFINSHNGEEIKNNKTLKGFFFRRIISCFIMLLISIFVFYYVIVFCSMYKKTQLNWFISGFWCILIEWVILCPIYILIISIVEKKGRSQKESSYYMKKLFLF